MSWRLGEGSVAERLFSKLFPPKAGLAGLTPDMKVQIAELALERDEFERALFFLESALVDAPGSERLWFERGGVLAELGRADDAVASYAVASRLSAEGDADFFAALLVLERSGDLDRAARLFVRALERSPEWALDADGDARLTPLLTRPPVQVALRAAIRRLEFVP